MEPFHSFSIKQIFERFETSPDGLNTDQVEKRQRQFGKNSLEEEKINLLAIFFRQFKSIPIYILLLASLISISLGEWIDFTVVIGIIILNGVIGFWQEVKAEVSIQALRKMTESKNWVIRSKEKKSIPSSELVPGDYLLFHEGEVVSADVRLIASSGLMVDEASVTGESVPVIKDHREVLPEEALPYELTNSLLAGTIITRGSGVGIAIRTGKQTYLASIAEKAKEASPETPLNKALNFFMNGYVFLLIGIFISLGVIGVLQGRDWIDLSYLLLAGLVSAVPEGLVVVITLVMVLGALALSKKQTLIRYLPSVETLGSVTVLASDKTGTITEGKLIVKKTESTDEKKLQMIGALCNDAHGYVGDPLDIALLDWVKEAEKIKKDNPRIWEHPFDTRLMLMATVNQVQNKEKLFVKGAYEVLKEKALNPEQFDEILVSFLEEGLRVIAFGEGEWLNNQDPSSWKIEIIGLIGFLDPPKEGVHQSVQFAKKAGIHVMMITGDHPLTGKAIAKEVGIFEHQDQVLTGKEIEQLSDQDLQASLKTTTVVARALPEHKYRIVKLLQESKEIVAVTGDGVNDVPALKAADIGISMGKGSEAAKSVSKMIITDNNLKVIVGAIRNARIIADNIRKVIYYLAGTTLFQVILLILAIVSNYPLPLIAIQILWVNLVGDGVQDKTFPFCKEEGNVMTRKPKKPELQFFDRLQIARIVAFGLLPGLVCFLLYVYLLDVYNRALVSTIIFTSVVVAQWANGIQAQKESEPFFKNIKRSFSINPWVYLGIALGLILQSLVIYLIPDIFHLVPMKLVHWVYPLTTFVITFFIVECRKWIEYISKTV